MSMWYCKECGETYGPNGFVTCPTCGNETERVTIEFKNSGSGIVVGSEEISMKIDLIVKAWQAGQAGLSWQEFAKKEGLE